METIRPHKAQCLYIALSDQLEDGLVLRLLCDGREALRVERRNEAITAALTIGGDVYTLCAKEAKGSLTIYRTPARLALYADDALVDEEWPCKADPDGVWEIERSPGVPYAQISDAEEPKQTEVKTVRSMIGYAPEGENAGVGDCMPFADRDHFRFFYLFDRRSHGSKRGLGAHRWAQASSDDLRTWTFHPTALDIDEIWEGSICTGSLVREGDWLYAFYAVRMTDGSAAQITWATSEDGIHFRKSGRHVTLSAPYDAVSARDPMVFQGRDGKWNMLVTTSIAGVYNGGCLAWLTGDSLTDWRQADRPFLVPGYDGQPECADWFIWDDIYYLLFSVGGRAHYRLSEKPYGPWRMPKDEMLPAGGTVRVPKTACFRGRRLAAGFLAKGAYAGQALFFDLTKGADGELAAHLTEETLPRSIRTVHAGSLAVKGAQGLARSPLPIPEGAFRLRATISVHGSEGGLLFGVPNGDCTKAELCLQPGACTATLHVGERNAVSEDRAHLSGIESGSELSIVRCRGILSATLDGRCLTVRDPNALDQPLEVTLYARWGETELTDVLLEQLADE